MFDRMKGRFGALMDSDGGDGDGGAAADAAAESVGGGTGPGGVAASGGEGGDAGIAGIADAQAAVAADAAAAAQAEEDAFGPAFGPQQTGIQSFLETPIAPSLGFLSPSPGSLALSMLGFAVPGIGTLATLGGFANALGATPGTDVDAFGADIGDVGSGTGVGGDQGAGGAANFTTRDFFAGTPNVLPSQTGAAPGIAALTGGLGFPGPRPVADIPNIVFPEIPAEQLAAFQQRLNRFGGS